VEALKQGANDYLQKPIDPVRLIALVRELLNSDGGPGRPKPPTSRRWGAPSKECWALLGRCRRSSSASAASRRPRLRS
jgi:DNA-binding response OmpR family regulator